LNPKGDLISSCQELQKVHALQDVEHQAPRRPTRLLCHLRSFDWLYLDSATWTALTGVPV